MAAKRFARLSDLRLTMRQFTALRRLDTPQKIQSFLHGLRQNFEHDGESCRPVGEVLKTGRAHCIEGAMLAAAALWVHGEPPLVLDMRAEHDFDHVVALFRRNGRWGAISKTNGIGLRWRDPVYRSLRELAMSYFHEYFDKRGRKTLRSYSGAFDLRRIDPKLWVTSEKACQEANDRLTRLRSYPLVSSNQARLLSRRDRFEREAAKLVQYPRATPPAWRY